MSGGGGAFVPAAMLANDEKTSSQHWVIVSCQHDLTAHYLNLWEKQHW